MQAFTFYSASDFSKFMLYLQRGGVWASVVIFRTRGGQFFAILCGHRLYGQPLIAFV